MGEATYCDSDDHSKLTRHLDGFVEFLTVTHGWEYTNPPFEFCPWCGKPIYAPPTVAGESS